jgi:predicted nucleic acid-binding protein
VIYFDTSYLVRLYFEDPGAEAVRALAATDDLACAAHGYPELIAAFHRKLRDGAIRPAAYAALLGQVQSHNKAKAFQWLALGPEILDRIAEVYAKLPSTVFLRAADAVHLATAAESGLHVVYSNDAHLLAAARHFGVEAADVIRRPN